MCTVFLCAFSAAGRRDIGRRRQLPGATLTYRTASQAPPVAARSHHTCAFSCQPSRTSDMCRLSRRDTNIPRRHSDAAGRRTMCTARAFSCQFVSREWRTYGPLPAASPAFAKRAQTADSNPTRRGRCDVSVCACAGTGTRRALLATVPHRSQLPLPNRKCSQPPLKICGGAAGLFRSVERRSRTKYWRRGFSSRRAPRGAACLAPTWQSTCAGAKRGAPACALACSAPRWRTRSHRRVLSTRRVAGRAHQTTRSALAVCSRAVHITHRGARRALDSARRERLVAPRIPRRGAVAI
jgi:hypothetical protein